VDFRFFRKTKPNENLPQGTASWQASILKRKKKQEKIKEQ